VGTHTTPTHGQRGFSLLESLIALVLCGLLLIGVIQGLLTTVTTSTMNRDKSVATARLAAVTDRFKVLSNQAGFYKPCTTPSQMKAAFEAEAGGTLDGVALQVVSVSLWNGSAYTATLGTCPTRDRGTQLLTVKVTVAASASSATGVVTIRNPWATP